MMYFVAVEIKRKKPNVHTKLAQAVMNMTGQKPVDLTTSYVVFAVESKRTVSALTPRSCALNGKSGRRKRIGASLIGTARGVGGRGGHFYWLSISPRAHTRSTPSRLFPPQLMIG